MAEYKGLTIRIGGDTSQLNTALKASTKAASTLYSQIRQVTRAMRFEPGNMENVATRMKLTTNRAEALYSKITLLKNAYSELGRTFVIVNGKAELVSELARSTENIALAATTAKERYNDMTATLASKYRELELRAKEAGKAMDLNALSRQGSNTTFETQMAQLKELGVVTDEEIQKLRNMRATWNEAFDSKEAYEAAEKLEAMSINMQRLESEARGAAATVRELNSASKYSSEAWGESTAKIKSMDSAISECANQARAYEAALREDPSSLSAAVGRLKALSNEYDLTEQKARELSQQVEAYKGRLSGVLAEQKNMPLSVQELGDRWQKIQDELSQAKGRADALHQSLKRLEDAEAPVEEIEQLKERVKAADAEVDELKADARQLDAAFETAKECSELEQLQLELSETEAHAASLQKRMNMTSLGGKSMFNASTIKSAGMTLYSTLTPAITMLGWRAVSAAQEIDSAYRDMRKTVNGTEQQFEELRQAAIDFSKTHVTSAEQMMQIMAIGGELGVATEDLQAFAETVSNLDVATNLNTEEAASSLGKLANITHMNAEEYDNFADALVRLGNNGASTEDQIVDIATRIGSMGTIVGMSVPEILALSSSIASTGMKTEAAGTAIANTFSDIESAVAAGGDSLGAFAEVAYGSADEAEKFATAWEEHPIEAFKAFIEGLNRIESEGGSAVATLESMGITGERQKQSILGLMQTIGGLNTNLEMSQHAWDGQSDAWGAAGDAAREAERKAEGFSGQLSILSNIANDAMASLVEGATPLIVLLSDIAKTALDAFDEMDDFSKTAIVVGLGIAAISGPMLTMASTFILAKQNMVAFIAESTAMGKALSIMKVGFAEAGEGAIGMKTRLASVGSAAKAIGKSLLKNLAVAGVIAGVTVLIAVISDYIKKMREAEEASRNAGDVIGTALGTAIGGQTAAIQNAATSYDKMVSKMAENNRKLQDSAKETYGNNALIEDYGESLKAALEAYNAGDKSAESMANLKTQLELYNSAAGTSISFTEDEAGALHLMKDGAELSADAFDKLTESMMIAAKAEFFKEGYETKMSDYRDALDEIAQAENEVRAAEDALAEAQATPGMSQDRITQLEANLAAANDLLDKSKQKLGETTSAMNQYEEGMKLMTEAQLENSSAAVKWLADNDEVQVSLWANGNSVTGFAHDLEELGVSYDELSTHSNDIKSLASNWDGSIASMIGGLREMGIEVDLSKAKIDGLNATEIEDKTYWVDDMGTIYDQTGKVVGLKKSVNSLDGKEFAITDEGTASDSADAVERLDSMIRKVTGKSVYVNANVSGEWSVVNLANAISNIRSKTVDITARIFGLGSATGSIADSPYIPRHASGYIATGPTLTNNGWVGEAGAEAVLNWGTGGTVVPLTNTRYMEPIADAIAKNLNNNSNSSSNVTYEINVTASGDGDDIARQVTKAIRAQELMRGRR
ncbi:MAG: phage tail tape measure protein [Eggerthellaceae bacterium]|nr:phage tail tape measure protein [Eggerthellaceae bacterium]